MFVHHILCLCLDGAWNQKKYRLKGDSVMKLTKSIDFLLEEAGPVIQYRLRKEILNDISTNEEEKLLEKIYQTPHFMRLQNYVKPSGYIGSGMHSWDNWRGLKLHETPLQDGETAKQQHAYYRIMQSRNHTQSYIITSLR